MQQDKLSTSTLNLPIKMSGFGVMLVYFMTSTLILHPYLDSASDKGDCGDILVGSPFKVQNLRDDSGVTVLPKPKYFKFCPVS